MQIIEVMDIIAVHFQRALAKHAVLSSTAQHTDLELLTPQIQCVLDRLCVSYLSLFLLRLRGHNLKHAHALFSLAVETKIPKKNFFLFWIKPLAERHLCSHLLLFKVSLNLVLLLLLFFIMTWSGLREHLRCREKEGTSLEFSRGNTGSPSSKILKPF